MTRAEPSHHAGSVATLASTTVQPGRAGAAGTLAPIKPSLRRDGDLLLTGRAEFIDDLALPGMLHMAILRSPHAHARIRRIDVAACARRPGVRGVLTGEQAKSMTTPLPHFFDPSLIGAKTAEFWCLAVDRVRWQGEPVVAVAADTLANAEAALESIEVEYEPLPAVLDVDSALEPDAPLVFEEWGDNVLGRFPFVDGDAAGRLAQAPHRIRDELRIGRHQSTPMEPRGYVGWWTAAGRIKFWGATQNPHPLRTNLATTLGVPESRIHVVATRLGGGFGHKFNGFAEEYLVCLMSRVTDVPVKWIESRAESLLVGAREFVHRFEVGFDDDGVVLAITDRILGNIGTLGTWGGWSMVFPAGMTFPGPYRITDYEVEAAAIVTHKAPWSGYRGYGKEQTAVVLERMMDLVANHLELDVAEVRRRNFIQPEEFPYWTTAMHLDSGDYPSALEHVLEISEYDDLRARQADELAVGRHFGVGVAFELTPESGDFANSFVRGFDASTVRVSPSGGVSVYTGVTSPGTGNETAIADLVAREFGISSEMVEVVQGDTESCPYGFGSFSSRSLSTGGAAAVLAARDLRSQMAAAAAVLLNCDVDGIVFKDGAVRSCERVDKALTFAELADTIVRQGLAVPGLDEPLLEATRIDRPHNFHHIPDEQGRSSAYPTFPYSAHVALVELDVETGVVRVERYAAVGDCGVIINERFVTGQLYGAVAQGIGGALWEEQAYDAGGTCLTTTLKHYLVPRAIDLPTFVVGHRVTPSPFTLLGTKGAGESGIGGAMAVITNAVNDALRPLGRRAHRLPLTPPTLLAAIVDEVGG
jgi:aerobic carbon-monoxide dehydrogenase large subunit